MIVDHRHLSCNERLDCTSYATTFTELADDLVAAIDMLEAANKAHFQVTLNRSILMSVREDHRSIELSWWGQTGVPKSAKDIKVTLNLVVSSPDTYPDLGIEHKDGIQVPNNMIDYAISNVAHAMYTYTKDPESWELLTHKRFAIFWRWSDGDVTEVNTWPNGPLG